MQYIKINQMIAEQIEQGMLEPGQKLPSERQLAESFDTTRVTLREALSLLEAEGLIFRADRRGWFISYPRLSFDLKKCLDFISLAQQQQRQPKVQTLLKKTSLANKQATQLLGLAPFSEVHQVDQLRLLESRPVSFVTYWISKKHFNDFLTVEDLNGVIGRCQDDYAVNFARISYTVTTSALLGDICQLLHATPGTPGVVITRRYYNQQGEVVIAEVAHWQHNALQIEADIEL